VTASTRTVFRSLSAKVIIFIQICHEVYNFVGDGETYYEKVVHSFMPTLFSKWKEAGTNHMVTIVLMARVFYEIAYAAEPLLCDEEGRPYRDFFRVIIDLEHVHEWKSILADLRNAFWTFRRDILLEYNSQHYRDKHVPAQPNPESSRVVGRLSNACDGPILEAMNLALSTIEAHFIDRSFSFTGSSTILITPGTGYFRVSKRLLRLTTIRLVDQGFGLDLICMGKPPLHQSPIFSFQGVEPELRTNKEGSTDARTLDPLWGGEDDPSEVISREKTTFWWEPFWMCVSFWDKQLDLPIRENR
jgi:DEP domain-containing protein 5